MNITIQSLNPLQEWIMQIYAVNAFSDLITYGQNALFIILIIKTILVRVMDRAIEAYSYLLHFAQLLPDHILEKLP